MHQVIKDIFLDTCLYSQKSVYGGDAWNTSDVRTGESYLHQFLHNQPDLNLRSPQVKDELNVGSHIQHTGNCTFKTFCKN